MGYLHLGDVGKNVMQLPRRYDRQRVARVAAQFRTFYPCAIGELPGLWFRHPRTGLLSEKKAHGEHRAVAGKSKRRGRSEGPSIGHTVPVEPAE